MNLTTVALDCRTALSPKTGDRTYTLTLLQGLAQLDLDPTCWRFQLLIDAPDHNDVLPHSPCFKQVMITAPNSRLWTLWAMPRWAWKARPDLVHVQYLGPPVLPCPFVTMIHDMVWRAYPDTFPPLHRTVMNLGMPATSRRAARILTVSRFSQGEIARYLHVPLAKISLTCNAVDEQYTQTVSSIIKAETREKYGIGAAPYVLSIGVQQPRKNVLRLIQAFHQLKAAHADWPHQLVIAGKPGWGEDVSSSLAGKDASINIIGYASDEDLPALYAESACMAFPSLYEGFGLPIIEAMACGAPVLTSDRGAMNEVARDAAELVNPEDLSSIKIGLENVLGDPGHAQRLREKGKVRAAQFTTRRMAADTLAAYADTLATG